MSAIAEAFAVWQDAPTFSLIPAAKVAPLKALLVVAHPDDESECAATIYRITHELGGIVDQIVITNGEGGNAYAAPAASYYRLPLHKQEGRSHLIRVRRREQLRASRTLGIRHTFFYGQKDTGVTPDIDEPLRAWDLTSINRKLSRLLQREQYDLAIVLLPTADTHGHHKAVAILTLQAVAEMPAAQRPAVAGVQTGEAISFAGLDGFPLTRTAVSEPAWSFDRHTPLPCHSALDHSIIVNWAASEHKSQGFFQRENGRRSHEYFWLFEAPGERARTRWTRFLSLAGNKRT